MRSTIHQQAKNELRQIAKEAKGQYPTDKPAIRQIINDSADGICRSMRLSEYRRNLLANYACTLHPKN